MTEGSAILSRGSANIESRYRIMALPPLSGTSRWYVFLPAQDRAKYSMGIMIPPMVSRRPRSVKRPDLRVSGLGYLWHFMIVGTFGIAYVLLFCRGRWLWALGWGTFVWGAMMVLMPLMMPMIDFAWWFPGVPFLAHLAMAVRIGWVALRLVKPEADVKSFVGLLRRDWEAAAMPS